MKRLLFAGIAAVVCALAGASVANAQTATFIYDDGGAGGGLPNSGTYTPGSTFTFSINLAFTPGGTISNLDGLSYWFQQKSPSSPPFPFSITLRDATGSPFSTLQTPSLTYPQNLSPSNANDLGGFAPGPAVGAGTYFIANITISIPLTAPNTGTFTLSQTLTGGKTSVISDSFGHAFAIPEADYIITMVPEPTTWLTPTLGVIALLVTQRRRIAAFRRS